MDTIRLAKLKRLIRPTVIIGVLALVTMFVGLAVGRSFEEAGIFAIGVGASMQLIFS